MNKTCQVNWVQVSPARPDLTIFSSPANPIPTEMSNSDLDKISLFPLNFNLLNLVPRIFRFRSGENSFLVSISQVTPDYGLLHATPDQFGSLSYQMGSKNCSNLILNSNDNLKSGGAVKYLRCQLTWHPGLSSKMQFEVWKPLVFWTTTQYFYLRIVMLWCNHMDNNVLQTRIITWVHLWHTFRIVHYLKQSFWILSNRDEEERQNWQQIWYRNSCTNLFFWRRKYPGSSYWNDPNESLSAMTLKLSLLAV